MKTLTRANKKFHSVGIESLALKIGAESTKDVPSSFNYASSDQFVGASLLSGATTSPRPAFPECATLSVFWPYETNSFDRLGYSNSVQLLAHLYLHSFLLKAEHNPNTTLVSNSAGIRLAISGRLVFPALSPALQCLESLPRKMAPLGELNSISAKLESTGVVLSWELILFSAIDRLWYNDCGGSNLGFYGCLLVHKEPDYIKRFQRSLLWFHSRFPNLVTRLKSVTWDDLADLSEISDFRLIRTTPFLAKLAQSTLMALFDVVNTADVDEEDLVLFTNGLLSLALKKAGLSPSPYLQECTHACAIERGLLITSRNSRRNPQMAGTLVAATRRFCPSFAVKDWP